VWFMVTTPREKKKKKTRSHATHSDIPKHAPTPSQHDGNEANTSPPVLACEVNAGWTSQVSHTTPQPRPTEHPQTRRVGVGKHAPRMQRQRHTQARETDTHTVSASSLGGILIALKHKRPQIKNVAGRNPTDRRILLPFVLRLTQKQSRWTWKKLHACMSGACLCWPCWQCATANCVRVSSSVFLIGTRVVPAHPPHTMAVGGAPFTFGLTESLTVSHVHVLCVVRVMCTSTMHVCKPQLPP
jgi:hypothetical protein